MGLIKIATIDELKKSGFKDWFEVGNKRSKYVTDWEFVPLLVSYYSMLSITKRIVIYVPSESGHLS